MNNGISTSAAKFVYKQMVENNKQGISIRPIDIVEKDNLWLSDEWTHLGYAIVTCIQNKKLVDGYLKGNESVLQSLVGQTIRSANHTVDAEFIKDLMPHIINIYFKE